jgi:4-amino-4-deoxy-L-arabinose transferase-like glycosyltransferase
MQQYISLFAYFLGYFGPVYLIVYLVYRVRLKKKLNNKYKLISFLLSFLVSALLWGIISSFAFEYSNGEFADGINSITYFVATFIVTYKFFSEKGIETNKNKDDLKINNKL